MKSIIKIEGMDCNGCAASIENRLSAMEGVNSVSISLADNEANVDYNSDKIKLEALNAAIDDLGFTVL